MSNFVLENIEKLKSILNIIAEDNIEIGTYNINITKSGKANNKSGPFPKSPGIYIFHCSEFNKFNENWLAFKDKTKKVPRINEERIEIKNKGSRVIYVGRRFESLSKRLNQHLQVKTDKASTYAMYLGSFAKFIGEELNLEIMTFSFNSDLDNAKQNIVIAALEAMFHAELQPLIGSSR
ncbi:GIY-YIG nuclease family protein [Bacillus massiliigorillae]|uniref:GIY-YIG nuclease family protein n=1 Tax=Bacillus massiliigorillae TaxID=1243664 RepID=UPI0003A2E2B2|nr:hypothetical protein [Bacillus massiliigorillae]